MTSFSYTVIGGAAGRRAIAGIPGSVNRSGRRGMARAVQGGASIVRGRASGRPGPRVISGNYRRSINGQIVEESLGGVTGQIGTADIRARRLELSFFGPDSLGRVFPRSRPYPHFGPSIGEVADLAVRELAESIGDGVGRGIAA